MASETAGSGQQGRVTDSAAPFGACSECGHVFGVCTPRLCPACGHAVMTQAEYDERKHIPLPTTTAASEDDAVTNALHIRLVCWDHKHAQVISAEALRQIVIVPICTAPTDNGICGSPIWAVEHEGEPTRYVGRPPHQGWASWADCVGAP